MAEKCRLVLKMVPVLPGLLLICFTAAAQTRIDTLLARLKASAEDTQKVKLLTELAVVTEPFGPDSSVTFLKHALSLSQKLEWEKGIAKNAISLAWYMRQQGDYHTSLANCLVALNSGKKTGNKKTIINALSGISQTYMKLGNYPQALDYGLQALRLAEELGDKLFIAYSLGMVSGVYEEMGDLEKAMQSYTMIVDIYTGLGNLASASHFLQQIGMLYGKQKDHKNAGVYLNKAWDLAVRAGDKYTQALVVANLGNVHAELVEKNRNGSSQGTDSNYLKAMDYFRQAVTLAHDLRFTELEANSLSNMGSLYLGNKQFVLAEQYLLQALSLAENAGILASVQNFEKSLSELYTQTGRHQLALRHYQRHIAANDSLRNEESTKKQTQLQMQYEFDKKQAADSIRNAETLKEETLKHEQAISQQRIYTYGGGAGFLLMLVVAGVSFKAYRQKQKANQIISQQKLLVEAKQKEILDSIYYARRIQNALLPTEFYIENNLKRMKNKSVL